MDIDMSESSHSRSTAGGTPLVSSERVIEAVAEAKGINPIDLDPLYQYLDLEALDALVASGNQDLSIRWRVDGAEVEVWGDGEVRVR